jgi:uncharacterized glyoxalase superfamily protein PhnB
MEVIFVETNIEKKPIKRSRNISLSFYVNAEEHDMIKRRMAQAGVKNLRAYILKQAIDGRVIHVELSSVNEMVRLLSNATNNINQVARRVNETGSVYAADVEDLRVQYDGLWTQAREILTKLAAL